MELGGYVAAAVAILLVSFLVLGRTAQVHGLLKKNRSYQSRPWWVKLLAIACFASLFFIVLLLKAA